MKQQLRTYLPDFIKPALRLLRYSKERRKWVRERFIKKEQDRLLPLHYDKNVKSLIVFFALGSDWATGKDEISGGILSIVSVCEETAKLADVHKSETIMCTMNNAHLLLQHEKFENNTLVYRFGQLVNYFTQLSSLVIHIPEMLAENFLNGLTATDKQWLSAIPRLHINVMNQNIRLMPAPAAFVRLKQLAATVTITTAHSKYCNPHYRSYFGVPIHKLSVWISPEQYAFTEWRSKENLLVVSPDKHPMKEEIMAMLQTVPGLKVQIIQNLTYKEYKSVVSRAKWTLTFGEGLDGYFIEPVFSGAIAFAVYNEDFFTPDFETLPTVYDSFDRLKQEMVSKMSALDNEVAFEPIQKEQFSLCARYYSKATYVNNIIAFYKGEFTYA
ncbi:MAG TPA: hypothetical protein VL307_02615 [Chitinophagaceae bacterium]|nr:hypothetical protein [Chitinophagaceae bacterium]